MDNVTDINIKKPAKENEAVLLTFTNHKDEASLGVLQGLLKMFYHTVLTNRLAIMQAKNTETGEEEVLLVGVEQAGSGMNTFPLALALRAEDVAKYIAPDGSGGWIEAPAQEAADA